LSYIKRLSGIIFGKTNKIKTMKKLFLLSVIAVLTLTSTMAQEEESKGLQGAWWGMGQFEFSDDETTSTFTLLPVVGNFISPSVTIGLGAGYTSTKYDDGEYDETDDAFILMPLVRKYWGISDKFYLFGQADVPLIFGDGYTAYGFNLSPGIDYFIGGQFTIEATFGQFGYNYVDPDEGEGSGVTSLGFNMFDVAFGLKYIF
jgi:hypothetical protein